MQSRPNSYDYPVKELVSMNDPIRIVVADDHPLFLTGLKTLLAKEPTLTIVGEARDGYEAQNLGQTLKPDIILLDLDMDGPPSHEIIQFLRTNTATTKILIVTSYTGDCYFPLILKQIDGYLLKIEPPETICAAIYTIMKGKTWFSQDVIQKIIWQQRSLAESVDQPKLTAREEEILQLVARGDTNRQISAQLNISGRTVQFHLHNIYDKLGINSRSAAIAWAFKTGLQEKMSENSF